jgi:hypothetical protein
MADVAAEFEPLETAVEDLETTFTNLGTAWNDFMTRFGLIDEDGQSTLDWLGTLGDLIVVVGGALLGIKAAGLLTGLIGGLTSLAGVAGGASGAMGTFSAIVAALGGPVVWIIALLGALAGAWATDFMGMQTTLTYLGELAGIIFALIAQRISDWDEEVSATIEDWYIRVKTTFR